MSRKELRIILRVPVDASDSECVDALVSALRFRREYADRASMQAGAYSTAFDEYKTSATAWWSKSRTLISYFSRGAK